MTGCSIVEAFLVTRSRSLEICAPLEIEDYGLQAAVFASPPKWHLAHTTWFFETFLLKVFAEDYRGEDPLFETLFNSYYNGVGNPFPRDRRGLLSRPTLEAVLDYRARIDQAVSRLLEDTDHTAHGQIRDRVVLGIEHERQHQELLFTDLKYSLAANPLLPTYMKGGGSAPSTRTPLSWIHFEGGLIEVGADGQGFCFDNELPRHRCYLEPFALANRLVTNGEYQDFVDDGGYQTPELWLADGWTEVRASGWEAPLHWHNRQGEPMEFTLYGLKPRDANAPVCHVSGYEADAYARWAGARLPTEAEWETAAKVEGAGPHPTTDSHHSPLHPYGGAPPAGGDTATLSQLYGEVWQWTQTAYGPYPGYRPASGAIGEYNGKFMSNQWVLRGGSCVTHPSQARPTYRNFFYPIDRWQFSGIRLAADT